MPRPPASAKIKPKGKQYTTRLSLTWPDGTNKQYQITRTTKEAVRDRVRELIAERDRAASLTPNQRQHRSTTIDQLVSNYLTNHAHAPVFVDGAKMAGIKGTEERARLCAIVEKHFGASTLVSSLGVNEIKSYKAARLAVLKANDELRKPATINHEIEILRALLNYAVALQVIPKSPFDHLKGIIQTSVESKRDRVPTFGEEMALLEQCYTKGNIRRAYYRSVLIIASDTGIRRNELCQLEWEWIDFKARTIHLPRQITKNNRARTIPMTDRVLDELKSLQTGQGKNSHLVMGGLTDFQTIHRNVCTAAKVTDLRLHDCRHAMVTRAIIVGVPLAAITAASGHVSDEWKRYANPAYDGIKTLLRPHGEQKEADVKAFAREVLHGLKRALGYDLEELLK